MCLLFASPAPHPLGSLNDYVFAVHTQCTVTQRLFGLPSIIFGMALYFASRKFGSFFEMQTNNAVPYDVADTRF